jgi:peptidoglycan/xylan/chitin deacetylase (PgdA/CDA1 family)
VGRVLAVMLLFLAGGLVIAEIGGESHRSHARAPVRDTPARAKPHRRPRVHGPHHRGVPILMYHVVSAPHPGAPYPELYTPAPVFAAQMRALARHGYHGVTLAQVDDYWQKGYALPPKPIVISFDDGYLSDYTHALPVLRGRGWPGVLNLELDNVRHGDLTALLVRRLIAAGWEVDSHTITHPDLTAVPDSRLRAEVVRSRRLIRARFHVPANYFCYPGGRLDRRVVAAVRRAGYRGATTTNPGLATPRQRFTLDRIRVDGSDGTRGLLAKLAHPSGGPPVTPGA